MGIRTGQDYIDSLRDGREVWISGERVEDLHRPRARNSSSVVAVGIGLAILPHIL